MAREGELSGNPKWLDEAEAAFQRRFGELDREGHRGLFDKLEQASVAAGMAFALQAFEAKLGELVQKEPPGPQPCPHCRKPCEERSEETEEREVLTRAGPVRFERRGFYCTSCRKVFFPSGPGSRPRD